MKNIIDNISYPVAIIIASLVLGGSFFLVQYEKQNSIERLSRQQVIRETLLRGEKENQERINKMSLNNCLAQADTDYWSYMELNGTKDKDGVIFALTRFWDSAKENKKLAQDKCFKQYK